MNHTSHEVEARAFLRTKIVATLGPASSSIEAIRELLRAGVNVCRLNFSHGLREQLTSTLTSIRSAAADMRLHVAVLGDLSGPKIRLNKVPDGVELRIGQQVRFVRGAQPATADVLTVNYEHFVEEVLVGHRIYIDDGAVRLLVTERHEDGITCHCTTGGSISSRKGVNLPDTRLSVPALTQKDHEDAAWAVENGLDFVALSFARQPADLEQLRSLLAAAHDRKKTTPAPPRIIVKIEKAEALPQLDEMIELADGVMVARGDLGVEMDVWKVPLVQKRITQRCRAAGKPVIVATQMLQSMIDSPMPTRAEVSDVANAILDKVDAIMLSAESATGAFPVESVQMMTKIAWTTEEFLEREPREPYQPPIHEPEMAVSATVLGAVRAAWLLKPKLVAVWTTTGRTAAMVAQHRLPMPVVGLAHDEHVCRWMALLHGVLPIRIEAISNPALLAQKADEILLSRGLVEAGDTVVLVTATQACKPGGTDTMVIHQVRAT